MLHLLKLPIMVFCLFATSQPGYCNDYPKHTKAKWIAEALKSLEKGLYPNVKAIAWWNSNFDDTKLKINSSKKSLRAYQKGIKSPVFTSKAYIVSKKLQVPSHGSIYHSANPDFGGTEDNVTAKSIKSFETLAQKKIVWAYFSNNLYNDIRFPHSQVKTIHENGKIPFIRLMPRSDFNVGGPDSRYTMQKIINGEFDKELTQWAIDAKKSAIPLLVEFGTEVNGDWFPWNGSYNGEALKDTYGDPAQEDGPERFRDAYKHIITLFRNYKVDNITWFFHVNASGDPEESWNTMNQYYPGDKYIDWLGLSVYGPQTQKEMYQSFIEIMDKAYPEITKISNKPVAILEFGITEI